jgi:RHS repeat-associated protein
MKAFLGTVLVAVHVSFGSAPVLQFSSNPTAEEFLRARVFDEPLVPMGGNATAEENSALAAALQDYAKRNRPDDFSALTRYLETHPQSPWKAALLTGLGLEYYNTAYYSLALDAWQEAWAVGQNASDVPGKLVTDRAVCELTALYARLGRMSELEALLKSIESRAFLGGLAERIGLAREALSMMQYQPAISFRCGPLALQRILLSDQSLLASAATNAMTEIFNSASTQKGFSLAQIADLSKKIGLDYRMARREKGGQFVLPSVVHWKAGHYAAMIRQVGEHYLLEDPTFGNRVWATKHALEAETSGYFLIPAGDLPRGWRGVEATEGATIWGKGVTSGNNGDQYACSDLQTRPCGSGSDCQGMAVSSVHLMGVNVQVRDTPVGYAPPVGPPVRFTVRYNHRDTRGSGVIGGSGSIGERWTHDWLSYLIDQPGNPMADVKYLVGGGGARTFTGFDTNTQTFAVQQQEQTLLRRTGADSYEMVGPNGSKLLFAQPDGSIGTTRKIFLTQQVDPSGNAVTLTYDASLKLTAIRDALGQVTTLSYDHPTNANLITRVTDPFGRFATFEHELVEIPLPPPPPNRVLRIYVLSKITDVLGLSSEFQYLPGSTGTIARVTTPYGATAFSMGQGPASNATMRVAEIAYPDGSRERVEYNQSANVGIANQEPGSAVPQGMSTFNQYLYARNTYHWSRNASGTAYGDHRKARIYHWLHEENLSTTSGILESAKQPLERRVWFDYGGQGSPNVVGPTDKPRHIGRVLDDGITQLYTYGYNSFGKITNSVDPLGRRLSFIYDTNGIDLVEVRQTRGANNELLLRATYNNQHRPLMTVDAAGQTNTYRYNTRGQLLSTTNPKNETTTYTYDDNAYLTAIDGPLPGTNDLVTIGHDPFGRMERAAGATGYSLVFDYDALNRLTRVTYPDSTFIQHTYDRLDVVDIRHRDGGHTLLEYDNLRRVRKITDAAGRETLFSWCGCGALSTLIDPMGRATEWQSDIQGRITAKQYSDGSKTSYSYETSTSRLRQVVDEKQRVTQYAYNRDDTLASIAYANTTIPTSPLILSYDTNYQRIISIADGIGMTVYSYNPISGTPIPGAGQLASIDGPLADDTITFAYDEVGRRVSTAVGGISLGVTYDAVGRLIGETNALGAFVYAYDGPSSRLVSRGLPNNQQEELQYGGNLLDQTVQRITHRIGVTPISEFLYSYDVPAGRITTWSQQAGTEPPLLHSFNYDDADQLLSATLSNAATVVNAFSYTYDRTGNRLTERIGATNYITSHNSLNQISTTTAPGASRSYEWDAVDRLVAVNDGNRRTEFTYDGHGRRIAIRQLLNGSEVSRRRFRWCGLRLCEERDASGAVVKRYFPQGMRIEAGPLAGNYYYTRDHLGSIREVIDGSGNLRARYAYDPFGRRSKLAGDIDTDFGFAGMFWSPEVNLSLTHFRAYDAQVGRWLSRDPLKNAELVQGPNLYAYVGNNPVSRFDPLGLICQNTVTCTCGRSPQTCVAIGVAGTVGGGALVNEAETVVPVLENTFISCMEAAPTLEMMVPEWEALAPEIEVILPEVEAALPEVEGLLQTLPGMGSMGPDTVNVLRNTLPQLGNALPLRDLALQARLAELVGNAFANNPRMAFFYNWAEASSAWRDGLGLKGSTDVLYWISMWSDSLF